MAEDPREDQGRDPLPNCGNAHKNPALTSTCRVCHHCFFILEPTEQLSLGPPKWIKEQAKLRILAASYDPRRRVSRPTAHARLRRSSTRRRTSA